jgi:ectoine hydroxylase-related dioxygenase (phytanoyl-CoA dioxygenase family)
MARIQAEPGFEIQPGVLRADDIAAIKAEVSLDHEILRRTGIRNLEKKFTSIARVAAHPSVLSIAQRWLEDEPRLVRALFFDKTPERNWSVAWHQDRTVALSRRAELPGWGPWTRKEGVNHVQPPCAVLQQMVTIRLHVDDADEEGGCLFVVPQSQTLGVLKERAIGEAVAVAIPRACVVRAGDALVMRPLILHSSLKSRRVGHRRVVHLEYSSYRLPAGISWA